jgi:hypothetical protein
MNLGTINTTPSFLLAHCQSRTSPSTDQSLKKSFHLFHAVKIELKKSPPIFFENKKYAIAQTNTTQTMTVKRNKYNGLQRRTDKMTTGNMGLASSGVKCLNSSVAFKSTLVLG